MIARMKKISFLLFYREKKKILYLLQKEGAFHLDLVEPEPGKKTRNMTELCRRYEKIAAELRKRQSDGTPRRSFPAHLRTARERLQYLEDRLSLKENYENALQELRQNEARLAPWGDFSRERLDDLRSRGLSIRFFIAAARVFDEYDFKDAARVVIHREGGRVYFLFLEYGDRKTSLPFEEVLLPAVSLGELREEAAIIRKNLEEDEQELAGYAANLSELEAAISNLKTHLDFEKAKNNLSPRAAETVYHLEGWFPAGKEKIVRSFLEKNGISYAIRDPRPGDRTPILLANGFFSRLFEPVTRIFALPDYFELDPTPFFAPFFVIFFGLCLGDLGYGLLVCLPALFFIKSAEPLKRLLGALGIVLGIAAALAGLFTNTFFGMEIFRDAGGSSGFLTGGSLAIFASYKDQGRLVFPVMALSLFIGFLQILLGILLRFLTELRGYGIRFALPSLGRLFFLPGVMIIALHGDVMNLGFNADFKIGPLPLGRFVAWVPSEIGLALFASGIVLIFFFNNPEKSVFLRPILGVWEFYGFITGLLGDLLSYIRLFALGLASGLLGGAFNLLALMALPSTPSGPDFFSPGIVLFILILVVGHGLNLGLSLLGSFVHPLRLTFVEFYKNMKFNGGGTAFRPFRVYK